MPVNPELQEAGRRVWSAGHWDEVADYVAGVGPRLLDAVGVEDGMRLLDVGTGSGGSVAIPAAQRGARVVGSDITATHFDDARRRASDAGVEVEWVEADALDLPFEDGSFDRVCSTFGHMFAPDHALAASELVRVTRPGGVIGLACWTPEGLVGRMFLTTAAHMPPPPPGVQPPPLWGSPDHVRELMEPLGVELEFERLMNVFEHESFEGYNEHFTSNFGPMVMAKAALGDRWPAVRDEIEELFAAENQAEGGGVRIEGEYLQTIARKPG
jgi:SAM-dependent methyltransferase